ncbi:hypothetical protein DFH09DRAFT_1290019 [Mycena vulgaris]|nr:hypothetical protein DFH09DRAFT_1290768 [Mycena vulgaris]KAJ6498637.1 hypothetical protein DFH09DRAFT_1290019 [Mycena vulgaris]
MRAKPLRFPARAGAARKTKLADAERAVGTVGAGVTRRRRRTRAGDAPAPPLHHAGRTIGVVVLEARVPMRGVRVGERRAEIWRTVPARARFVWRRAPPSGGIESRAGVRECGSWRTKWGLASNDDDEGQGRRLTRLWAREERRDSDSGAGQRARASAGEPVLTPAAGVGYPQFLNTFLGLLLFFGCLLGTGVLGGHPGHGGGLLLRGVGVRGREERRDERADSRHLVDEVGCDGDSDDDDECDPDAARLEPVAVSISQA